MGGADSFCLFLAISVKTAISPMRTWITAPAVKARCIKYPGDQHRHYSRYFIEIKPRIKNSVISEQSEVVCFIWIWMKLIYSLE